MSPLSLRITGTRVLAATLISYATGVSPAQAAPIRFEDHADYPTGSFPFRVTAADLDGDGDADLVTANPDAFNPPFVVTVLVNLGSGTFAPAAFYATGEPGRGVAAGDLDGDGDRDLAVGLQAGDFRVAVLENDSHGQFAAPQLLAPLAGRPDALAIVDLDGDLDQDILLGQAAGDEIVVLKNNGGGNFAPPVGYGGPSDAYFAHFAVGDVDADGDPDCVFSRSLSITPPSLYRNRGDGTFDPRAALPAPVAEFAGVDLGDLDGDLDLDLVLVSETGHRVAMLRNDGTGAFSAWNTVPSGVETQLGNQVTVADLDGDGLADVIVPAANTHRLATLQSGGASGLAPATFHELGGQPVHVNAADLDNDGDLDLSSGLPHSDEVSVLRNITAGTTTVAGSAPAIALSFGPAYSNPTPLGATIPYQLAESASVRISVLDVAGRRVRALFRGELAAGVRAVTWDGRNERGVEVPPGVYLVELHGGTWRRTARIVVTR